MSIEETKKQIGYGKNTGHGHVWKRPDGILARCGGPGMCSECKLLKAMLENASVEELRTEQQTKSLTIGDMIGRYDLFWVFVPSKDAWRLGKMCGSDVSFVGVLEGNMWMIMPTLSNSWEAVGIVPPKHPRSVETPKASA